MDERHCYACGRLIDIKTEGRCADGRWCEDDQLPAKALDGWFCSFRCYRDTIDFSLFKLRTDRSNPEQLP